MSIPWPSDELFFATQLSEEEKALVARLSPFANYQEIEWVHQTAVLEKVSKCRKALAIIVEQERPQSTEQEESTVNYWTQQLNDFRMKDSGEAYLLNLKAQIEAKYRAAMADVEAKLQQSRANHHQKESYFTQGLQNAQHKLDAIRSHKSKPRIRAEMELADAEKPMIYDRQHSKWRDEYKVLKAKLDARKRVWYSEQMARREAAYQAQQAAATAAPAKSPPPKPIKKMRKAAGCAQSFSLTQPSYAYQYSVSQTDGNGNNTTSTASFAMIPWSPMSLLA
jgi:hypothetical protein